MFVCLCYGVSDQDISKHLGCLSEKTTMKGVHTACSGAPSQKCGKCGPMIKDMVDHHNNKITISEISDTMQKAKIKKKETI